MKSAKKIALTILKIGLTFGLLAWLILRDTDTLGEIKSALLMALESPHYLLLAFAATGGAVLCGCIRWNMILKTQKIILSLKETTQLFLIGHFFNSVMPGAVGGDVIKAVYTARVTKTRKTEAVTSIVIDRTIGLFALLLLISVMIAFKLSVYMEGELTAKILPFLCLFCLGAVAGIIILFSKNLFTLLPFLDRWQQKVTLIGILKRVYDAFYVCRSHPGILLKATALSVMAHIMTVTAAYFAGCAVQLNVAWMDFLIFFPIIAAVRSIPLFPGGLGIGEMAAAEIFADRGAAKSISISMSFVYFGILLVWSLVGGIVFMMYTSRGGSSIKEELQSLKDTSADSDEEENSGNLGSNLSG